MAGAEGKVANSMVSIRSSKFTPDTEAPPTGDGEDWAAARALLDEYPTKYGSLNWIASRPLIAGLNHFLSLATGGLVAELRSEWVKQQAIPEVERVVDQSSTSSWVVIGDTGEQDGSQYVVCRALSEFCRGGEPANESAQPGFMVMMSDVIYPAGDVEDYGYAVYHPYRLAQMPGPAPASVKVADFTITQPIYGLPGNHDWYDGLSGFMYHFAHQDPLPDEAYRHTWHPVHWVSRVLWRRARPASDVMREARAASSLSGSPQPGPYYTIQTAHVLLVCIDTGIDGRVDAEQFGWLHKVSAKNGAKILITGKPLVVDRKINESPMPDDCNSEPNYRSVWELVNDPDNCYVATVGGDIHNFQMYPRKRPPGDGVPEDSNVDGEESEATEWEEEYEASGTPLVHIVAGGGGAFTHGTHVHHNVAQGEITPGSRRTPDKAEVYPSPPTMTFPSTPESLRFFAYRLIGGINRAIVNLVVMASFLAAGAVLYEFSPWPEDPVPGTIVAGVALLVLAAVVRAFARNEERVAPLPRRVVTWLGSPGIGLLLAGLTYWLVPQHAGRYLLTAAGLALLLSAISAGARQTRWWVRKADTFEPPRHWLFWLGLLALSAALGLTQVYLLDKPDHHSGWVMPAAVLFLVGVFGWVVGRRKLVNWQQVGGMVIPLLQVGITLTVVGQLAGQLKLMNLYGSALLGGVVGVVFVTFVTWGLVLLTSLIVAVSLRLSGHNRVVAWGKSARLTWFTWNAALIVATVGWAAVCAADPWRPWLVARPSLGLPAALVAVVSVLFVVDWLRRRLPKRYVWVVLAGAVALSAAAWLWQELWWVRVTAAAVVIIFGLLVGATVVHFSFLGAYLLACPKYRPILHVKTDAELEELMPDRWVNAVFARRAKNMTMDGVPNHERLLFWIRMTAPGLTQPGGPVQHLVAELFSTDVPPFHKSFLSFRTAAAGGKTSLTITLHEIFGSQAAKLVPVATVTWRTAADSSLLIGGKLARSNHA